MKKVTAMLFSMAVGLNAVSMAAKAKASEEQETDVLLIGGGIMSATLGTYLRELEPEWSMTMVERLEGVAQESSNGWNNAGTGHSALMELNYTPQNADGSISIEKAVAINEAFQISRQFWAHQVERGVLRTPRSFINTVPHMSFVWGEDNVNFLRARYAALQQSSLFRGMRYSEDHAQIKEWAPLVMEGRDPQQKVAATRTEIGTDVNYGEITRQLIASLQKKSNFSLQLSSEVRALKRNDDNTWTVTVADLKNGTAPSSFCINARNCCPWGITTNASDNVLINGARSGLFSTSPMRSLNKNTATHTTIPSPTFSQYSVVSSRWLISFR